jgi:hypothetical protein
VKNQYNGIKVEAQGRHPILTEFGRYAIDMASNLRITEVLKYKSCNWRINEDLNYKNGNDKIVTKS